MLGTTSPLVIAALTPGLLALGLGIGVLPWLDPRWPILRPVIIGVAIALMVRYLVWRVCCTLPPVAPTAEFFIGLVFLVIEALAIVGGILSMLFLARTGSRIAEADAHLAWTRDQPPLIDVLICTYDENRDILERTIVGALAMTYPNFRTWVLDDSRRPWLQLLCQQLGCGYITRADNVHAKAGNINNALQLLDKHEIRPAFISILDADFVPKPSFLERALALFYKPDVGLVQTPQHFINPDPIQNNLSASGVWPDEQRFFFDIVMPCKDAWSAAFCCGTSSLIRFEPLVAIGGFPTDSVTEDYLLTLRLKEAGYRTVYLNEPLSLGLAPEGIKEYITQRGRWCLGFMQIFRSRSGPFSRRTKLGLVERLSLIENFLNWSAVYATRVLGLVIPQLYLLCDIKAVHAGLPDMLDHFLPCFVWQSLTMAWIAQGRVLPFLSDVCQLISAPTILKAVAAGFLKPRSQKFRVTAKGGDRSRGFVEWPLLRFYGGLLVTTLAAIGYFFDLHVHTAASQYSIMALVWSWYNVVILLMTCFVCVELPRHRKSERFNASASILVQTDTDLRACRLKDISITGARFAGAPPASIGANIAVVIDGRPIAARIVRDDDLSFAVEFDSSLRLRIAMIRHFYGQNYAKALTRIDPSAVGRAVLSRIFG